MKGDGQSHGAVEVNLNGKWGSVCNQDWDQNDVGTSLFQEQFSLSTKYTVFYFSLPLVSCSQFL